MIRKEIECGFILNLYTFKCNSNRCNVCDTLNLTREFTSSTTGQTFQINYELNCNAMSVIYLITCKICSKQYVGETTNKWRKRWNNYIFNNNEAKNGNRHTQPKLHSHFLQPDHHGLQEDAIVTLIDKTNSVYPKIRERFWIKKLQTLEPCGLNETEKV